MRWIIILALGIALLSVPSSTVWAQSVEESARGSIQWDQNKIIQNARLNYAINETRVCVKNATVIALRQENETEEGSGVLLHPSARLNGVLVLIAAKATKMTPQQQTDLVVSLINGGIERLLRSGR